MKLLMEPLVVAAILMKELPDKQVGFRRIREGCFCCTGSSSAQRGGIRISADAAHRPLRPA